MKIARLDLPEVCEIVPQRLGDERGYFSEVYRRDMLSAAGVCSDWIQDNQSWSAQAGTVRGLHLQAPPFAQDKLVRVLRGAIFDVAVDVRRGSPRYGSWVGLELSAEKWNQLLIPKGFAHGFMTLLPDTEVLYKVSAPYNRDSECAIRWNDKRLAINWPELGVVPTLSEKDRKAPLFVDHDPVFDYED